MWEKVEQRTPNDIDVIAYNINTGRIFLGWYDKMNDVWHEKEGDVMDEPTHWQAVGDLPEE